eukprot:599941-Amphidinium_carterae.1
MAQARTHARMQAPKSNAGNPCLVANHSRANAQVFAALCEHEGKLLRFALVHVNKRFAKQFKSGTACSDKASHRVRRMGQSPHLLGENVETEDENG